MKDPVAHLCRRLDELQRRRDELGDRTDAEAMQTRGLLDELEDRIRDQARALPRDLPPLDSTD